MPRPNHPARPSPAPPAASAPRPRVARPFRAALPVGVARWAGLALLAAAPLASCGGSGGAGGERIVLITLDTLRWDSLAGVDGEPGQMPRLAELAREGTLFERYYSATSTTQPTHASLFTGLHPWQHGVPFNGAVLAPEHETVVERLQAAGYYTAAAIASFPVHSQFGWDQGFFVFRDELEENDDVAKWSGVEVEAEGFFNQADRVADQAIELIDGAQSSKQFFWFHMYDPHAPYGDSGRSKNHMNPREITQLVKAGQPADDACRRARHGYDRDVAFMDEQLGRVIDRLKQDAGWTTHFVVVSDHGESFGEGGSVGHGKRLTPEQVHVPLVVHSPRVAPGVRATPVGTLDVAATLLALGGLGDLPAGGRDLTSADLADLPVMGMRRIWEDRYVELRVDGTRVVIEPEHRRFFLVDDEGFYAGGTGGVSLDDSEVPLDDTAKAAELEQLFDSFAADFNARGYRQIDDADTIDKLRAMGYIGDDEHDH